jgi:alpha-pyrone synthase
LGRALHDGELMAERDDIDLWAVHPGGRSILDAVEKGLELPVDALAASREVLSCFGNMSSATVMFVLQRIMQQAQPRPARLRDVVWPRADGGDNALSCGLVRRSTSV